MVLCLLLSANPQIRFQEVLDIFRTHAAVGEFFDLHQKTPQKAAWYLFDGFVSLLMDFMGLNDLQTRIQKNISKVQKEFWPVECGWAYRSTYVAILKSALVAGTLDLEVPLEQLVHITGMPEETISMACNWLSKHHRIRMSLIRQGVPRKTLRLRIDDLDPFNW